MSTKIIPLTDLKADLVRQKTFVLIKVLTLSTTVERYLYFSSNEVKSYTLHMCSTCMQRIATQCYKLGFHSVGGKKRESRGRSSSIIIGKRSYGCLPVLLPRIAAKRK